MDIWPLMSITRDQLGRGTAVKVQVLRDPEAVHRAMAEELAQVIRENNGAGRATCLIVPVGPVGQYEILARIIAESSLDCSRVTFINMDEFLGDDGDWIDPDHPLSFRGFMERSFYRKLPAQARFLPENRVFPNPEEPELIGKIIAQRGGVDVCFGGIGLNGHVAFNEPEPEKDDLEVRQGNLVTGSVSVAEFAESRTRVLRIAPESQAHMAVNLSCALDLIPRRAVTVGMKEILGARRLSLYANRPWQRGVVRQALHGPVTPRFPASYIQRHADATLTITEHVAEAPEVRLQ